MTRSNRSARAAGTLILAIDPGHTESGWVLIDGETCQPLEFGKTPNVEVLDLFRRGDLLLANPLPIVVIEMVASYGMSVGADVFETCVWVGRFQQHALTGLGTLPALVKRLPVKLHHCHDSRAKDSNIVQALVDRFAAGQPNHGKGTKADPGWFYGFRADIWQAYALAVYAADQIEEGEGQ